MTTTASELTSSAEDELVTEILARRRHRAPRLTVALVLAVVAAAAFVGGAEAQKHLGSSSSSSGGGAAARAAFASRFGGSGGLRFGGNGGSVFPGGGAVSGTVTLIKGSNLYVTDSSGNTVVVHAGTARVTQTSTSSLRSIRPGDSVTVVGTQGSGGSYTARSIALTNNG
jgi:hypothetical protein